MVNAGRFLAETIIFMDLSIIIPFYNEEENIEPLVNELAQVLNTACRSFEVIFVDDKSTDESLQLAQRFKKQVNGVCVELNSHQGKTAALLAGFQKAQGQFVITLDADLQDDPAEIPRF